MPFKVLLTPCHTLGSVMYLLEIDKMLLDSARDFDENSFSFVESDEILDLGSCSLFTGDTIFSGGVGTL